MARNSAAMLAAAQRKGRLLKSTSDKIEPSVDSPSKSYMGSFGRESVCSVKIGPDEVLLHIARETDEKRQVAVLLNYYLLAELLSEISGALAKEELSDRGQIRALRAGGDALVAALKKQKQKLGRKKRTKKASKAAGNSSH